jgi:glutamine synthetase
MLNLGFIGSGGLLVSPSGVPGRVHASRSSVQMAETVSMDPAVLKRYMDLPVSGKVQAEYVWIDGDLTCRSKCRTVESAKATLDQLPDWNYDGSSTGQAPGDDSEVIMKPRAVYPDPFRGGDNILVLCDTYTPGGTPLPTNTRAAAVDVLESPEAIKSKAWYGLEQEYTLFQMDKTTPLGWPKGGYPGPQGPYYCSVGADRSYGRAVSEAHYKACLYANIAISGTNAEVMPGQWEFQVGPSIGIAAGDDMWMARYLLDRVCEDFNVYCTLDPKPISGDWNGAGCHTNFSTEKMREAGGLSEIVAAIKRLGSKHQEHIAAYGEGNERRLTGKHETASWREFSFGVANRGCSVRIPRMAEAEQKGYFEDRRPASNMDPYVVTMLLCKTGILDE